MQKGGLMATPGSVDSQQIHDPQEKKVLTNQNRRFQYLFRDLKWQGGRRSLAVWETDGGNVPAEENVYLVGGDLKQGKWAFLQWKFQTWMKQIQYFFSGRESSRGV